MNIENNNINKTQILLPPKVCDKKTLVLDLDETLVHSQFMTFSNPSDVVIKIEIENEIHDIHVMVRPGVKEFLEKMEKFYEIVIFTASVSKYADPLLDIIDKNGYCPYRLFREHCSLFNTTFVKDLKRLGRDLKNIVIVDNSPLSYSLHPENGLPISTWFEDKSDRELYKIMPILEFLSNVHDVREIIPKLVGKDNQIDYEKAKQIIKNYNSSRVNAIENDENKKNFNNNYKNKGKEINLQIINNNNANQNNSNKENLINKHKLVEMAMKNIIASVNPNSVKNNNNIIASVNPNNIIASVNPNSLKVNNNNIIASVNPNYVKNNNIINNNQILKNKGIPKNKIFYPNKKNYHNEEEKNNMKMEIINSINVKKISNNNNPHSAKKYKPAITDINAKSKQKRKNYSSGSNYVKVSSINLNPEGKSIILKTENSNYNNLIKAKNTTPKINKTFNLINKINHTTRSVKYTKKTNTCSVAPTSLNNNNNIKISKSLTKNVLKSKNNNNINKENSIQNKNNKIYKYNNNNLYKSISSNTTSYDELPIHKKQKTPYEFISLQYSKNIHQLKNSADKQKKNNTKIEKIEIIKKKNIFLKTGFIQNKKVINKLNNINTNLTNNLALSYKLNKNNLMMNNFNNFDTSKTIRGPNQMKYNLTNSNILSSNSIINYSPNNKYNKTQIVNNSINHYLKMKNIHKNNYMTNNKLNSNFIKKKDIQNKVGIGDIYEPNSINKIKTTRPKSSTTVKIENKNVNFKNHNNDSKKIKAKYQSKIKFEINEILQKRGISGKIKELKNN